MPLRVLSVSFCLFFGHVATATLPHHKQKSIRQSFSKSVSYKFKQFLRQRKFILEKFPEIFKTKSKADIFEILNASFFLIKTGCQWKLLPNDFPNYHRLGQSSCICVRLFRSQCNRIAPSLREHICMTLDRPGVNKYWGTGSNRQAPHSQSRCRLHSQCGRSFLHSINLSISKRYIIFAE